VAQLDTLSQEYASLNLDAVMGFYDEKVVSQSFDLPWKSTQGAAQQRQVLQEFFSRVAAVTIDPAPSVDVWREGESRTWTTRPLQASFSLKNGDAYSFSGFHSAIWEPRDNTWRIWYENFWGTLTQTAWGAPPVTAAPAAEPEPVTPPAPALALAPEDVLQDVFFDLDKYNIRADQVAALTANATYLVQHPEIKLLLQGHCDERASRSYNMRLGARRAQSVKRFLVQHGVAEDRIETVSFGKEKPFAIGVGEDVHQLNRRVHFVVRSR
jgi:peptidoglycan-associated lipoprotein